MLTLSYNPLFIYENCHRTLRHTLQSLRPILDIIVILFLIIAVFSLLGYNLFKQYKNNRVSVVRQRRSLEKTLRIDGCDKKKKKVLIDKKDEES